MTAIYGWIHREPPALPGTSHRPVSSAGAPKSALTLPSPAPDIEKRQQEHLATLRSQWHRLLDRIKAAGGGDDYDYDDIRKEIDNLVSTSVAQLLSSDEMAELQAMLTELGHWDMNEEMNTQIALLLAQGGPLAHSARERLVRMESPTLRNIWSYAAGAGCNETEFGKLLAALKSPGDIINARFGSFKALAAREPLKAVRSALDLIQAGAGNSGYTHTVLKDIIDAAPADADFAAMEQLLIPKGRKDSDPRYQAHEHLFSAWAKHDPVAAANYIAANDSRLPVELMGVVAQEVLQKDVRTGMEWVQNLEPGKYRDRALEAVVPFIQLEYSKECVDLINQIDDAQLRNTTMRRFEARGERRGG